MREVIFGPKSEVARIFSTSLPQFSSLPICFTAPFAVLLVTAYDELNIVQVPYYQFYSLIVLYWHSAV
jgi:hypothetical protein